MTRREDLAWAAGLFEGEGCFSIYKPGPNRGNPRPHALLSMTDRDVMERFVGVAGLGKILGPYAHTRNGQTFKPHWNWSVSGFESVQYVLAMFWPWLGERRRARAVEVLSQAPAVAPRKTVSLN